MGEENQHYVPKFLIKKFADADGRVFCLNIQTDEITKPPPKHAASSAGFNDFVIAGRKVSFEDRLEKVETRAAPVIRKIIVATSQSGLSDVERKHIANFVAAQSFRTEAFRKGMALPLDKQKMGAIFEQLWRSSFLVADEIERRKWALMLIDHDDVFYLGDQPVVLQNTESPASAQELGFDIRGVEAFLPLAPKLALYMPCLSTTEEIISGRESALFLHRRARLAVMMGQNLPGTNGASLRLIQSVLRNGHQLYDALSNGVAFVCPPENVENLNYLQCAWAHKAVFSNRGDFAFAKRVLRESPQYRKVPRTSFAVRA